MVWQWAGATVVVAVCATLVVAVQCNSREQQRRIAQLESELAGAKLCFVRMQLNPHFLANSLHSLTGLMRENVDAAEEMAVRLGALLRFSLKDVEQHEVMLRREIEMLDAYLAVQRLRYAGSLPVQWEIDSEVTGALVPGMVLQPLVENCIEHGLAPRTGPIEIRAGIAGGNLRVEVTDHGPGFPLPL